MVAPGGLGGPPGACRCIGMALKCGLTNMRAFACELYKGKTSEIVQRQSSLLVCCQQHTAYSLASCAVGFSLKPFGIAPNTQLF
jgi:hypothetical protein